MRVEIAYASAVEQTLIAVEVEPEATVSQALQAVANRQPFAGLPLHSMPLGIFGRPVARDTRLRDGDRLELYRPLLVDPKEARRRRAGG